MCSHVLAAGERVSSAGDVQAVRWLRCACAAVLAALPTTMEQDEAWLVGQQQAQPQQGAQQSSQQQPAAQQREEAQPTASSPSLADVSPSCRDLAVQWRLGYKRILAMTVAMCDASVAAWL